MASNNDSLVRLMNKYFPRHIIGEILTKRWVDNAVPFLSLVLVLCIFGSIIPNFFSLTSMTDLGRQVAEFGLVVLALSIVMISGGIDLSVASIFTLAVLLSLIGINVYDWPVFSVLGAVLFLGAACGAVNGYLIGYLRLRAFLTTLVTLVIFRSIYDIFFLRMSTAIVSGFPDSELLFFIGEGSVLGIPFSL